MRLRGTYTLKLGGRTIVAHNAVTDAGLLVAARLLSGQLTGAAVGIALKDDGASAPTDTLAAHPGWNALTQLAPTTLAANEATVQTPLVSLVLPVDGVAGGCYLTVNGVLFSVAEFEPEGVIRGDTVELQYELRLSR